VASPASIHDLRILEENISETAAPVIMRAKAYISKKLQKQAKLQGKEIIIPQKKPRGGKLSHTELAENKRISKTRQVIESSFTWLHSRTDTKKAHLVCSLRGLIRHIYVPYLICLCLGS